MKIAALILGILGGLSGLSIAAYGNLGISALYYLGISSDAMGAIQFAIWAIPLACLAGAGLAITRPSVGGLLMALSALGWLGLGEKIWHGLNIFTGSSMILGGTGGLLALLAAYNSPARSAGTQAISPTSQPVVATQSPPAFDAAKWSTLLQYDADVMAAAEKIRPSGEKWVQELATAFLSLQDKSYLPAIIERIESRIQSERLAEERARERAAANEAMAAAAQQKEREADAQIRREQMARSVAFFWGTRVRRIVTVGILFCIPAIIAAGWLRPWNSNTAAQGASASAANSEAPSGATFSDPFSYCTAIGMIDSPDQRYVGPKEPDEVKETLATNLHMPKSTFDEYGDWRCYQGLVYACYKSTGMSCYTKMNTSIQPSNDMKSFCVAHPNSPFMPVSILSNYASDWNCDGTQPRLTKMYPVDAEGYFSPIWHLVGQ